MKTKKRFLLNLHESTYEWLRSLAYERHTSVSAIIRKAIDKYLDEIPKHE